MQGNCEGAGGALVPHAQEAITDARIPVRWAAGERGTAGERDTAPEALVRTVVNCYTLSLLHEYGGTDGDS